MSSGRDVMMESWESDEKVTKLWKLRQIERLEQLLQTYLEDLPRIYKHIARLQMEIENETKQS